MSASSKRSVEGLDDDPRVDQKVKPEPATVRIEQDKSAVSHHSPLLFSRSEATLYTSLATLPQRAGVAAPLLPLLNVKEYADNGLDTADAAGRPGAVEISIDSGNLIVADQGIGIPDTTPEQIASLFCVARPMISSKLLRRPTRGAVGNGLRVCLGYLTATGGRLIIETGALRVELLPEIDGTSTVVSSMAIEPIIGLTLTAIAGDVPFVEDHLVWAENAIELAQQSGVAAFTSRPSPWWFDLDHFRMLLRSGVGNVSVRQLLGEMDGLTGSRAQTRIAARFLRRPAASLDAVEAAELLAAAQAATKPPKPRALRPLGRGAVVTAGYAIAEGTFTEGQHAPHAHVPFLVECWADAFHPDEQEARLVADLYMNRTLALATCTGGIYYGKLDLTVSSTSIRVTVPAGPHYSVTINITAPMFRMISDGKTPDCHPFRAALDEAIGKAARQAGGDIAAQIATAAKRAYAHRQQQQREEDQQQRLTDREARERRLARIAEEKAEQQALPSIRDVVLDLLPGAVEIESRSGLLFNTRRLVYRIRDEVLSSTGKELQQQYFDVLLTEIEAEHGDLSPLLIREPRGFFKLPHHPEAKPLGTITVRGFLRPAWNFNKIVVIEKEDLRRMLEEAGWDNRNDALVMSAIGFATRAGRDLIDKIAVTTEPVKVFSVHDGDSHGTVIQHTLQHATLARAARKIEVIDLGLQPWEGVELGLSVERVPIRYNKDGTPRRREVGEYVRAESSRAPSGETWEEWLQHSRVELNALTSQELIEWLDRKMVEHGAGKLIPPDDILIDGFGERIQDRAGQAVAAHLDQRLADKVAGIEIEQADATKDIRAEIDRITADLRAQLDLVSEPFHERIDAVTAEYQAIDSEAMVDRVIKRATPEAEELREAISAGFSNDWVALPWDAVLHDIADNVEVGDIGAPDGGTP